MSNSFRKYLASRMRTKLRLVIMKDETFEEKFALRLTPLKTFILVGVSLISLIILTTYIIAFTNLREYIPGYADVGMKRNLIYLSLKTDSLTQKIIAQEQYISNLNEVINGKAGAYQGVDTNAKALYSDSLSLPKSAADSQLRQLIESQDQYDLDFISQQKHATGIAGFSYFTPVTGTITETFNPALKHFGIDVVAAPNEPVKSTLDGTVVFAGFTSATGYVIAVQHSGNLFSIYKHNAGLLKSVGDYVNAGDAIAIIGNSGELSQGPHLHFELWYNGSAVNPTDYMSF
ncbi:MAG: M23 family metallopeptidase [Bacteroidia bacterium]|nr:M23 family metallopeptidase [Bacteroidia bacterium]HQU99729.1 M23 family metallopeptidase [Bacteroidia bacterium]